MNQRSNGYSESKVALMVWLTLWLGFVQARGPDLLAAESVGVRPPAAEATPASAPEAPRGPVVAASSGPTLQGSALASEPLTYTPPDSGATDRFVQAKLAEIGAGVDKAFAFVRDQIGFEAYVGSLRGARGTLWSEAGNSLDKASLLLALLGAQGLEVKYVRGTLAEADARELIGSMFDPVVAANAVGYIPERYPKNDPLNDPSLIRWVSDHWWVELDNGTALDPCFRNLVVGQTRGVKTAMFEDVPDELRHMVVVRLKVELHNPLSQYSYQTPLEVMLNTADVYGRALTLGHFINVYQPPALVTGWKTYTYSPYLMVDDNDTDWTNNHLIRGSDYQEFLTGLMPLANSTLTRLTLEFEVRDPGKAPDLRSRDILDRVGYAARKGLAQPRPVDTTKPALTEWDVTTFFVTPGMMGPALVPPHQAVLAALDPVLTTLARTVSSLTNKPVDTLTAEDQTAVSRYAALNRAALTAGGSVVLGAFLLDSDHYLRQMRDAHQVRAYYHSPRITSFEAHLSLDGNAPTLRLGLDLRRNHVLAVPYPGQSAFDFFAFNLAKGRVDSLLEYLTVEHFLVEDHPEVRRRASPIQVLQAAKTQAVRLGVLRGEQDIPTRLEPLPLSPEAKARIADALRSGEVVNVPVEMVQVDGQPSIGWWRIDLRTGELVAAGEEGGNQNLIEFGLILSVIVAGGIFVLSVLGGNISTLFTAGNAKPRWPGVTNVPTTPPDQVSNTSSGLGATQLEAYAQQYDVEFYADGSASFRVGDQVITLPHSAIELENKVMQTLGSSGSVVDWAGTDVEVILNYAPGPLDTATNAPVVGSDFNLVTAGERSFVVKHRENAVPSAYRLALENSGAPDPGNLSAYLARTNEPLFFRVTGTNQGTIWGTDLYTDTSPLATAAVHAGVLTNGQTGTLKVRLLPPGGLHPGSTRNGVTSRSYVGVPAGDYRVEAVDLAADVTKFRLSGTAPVGWNLLFARTNVAVPPGVTGQFSVFLQPDAAAPLPAPGTIVPFAIEVAPVVADVGPRTLASDRSAPTDVGGCRRLHGSPIAQPMTFTVPEVYGLRLKADPALLYASPEGSVLFAVQFENTGNMPVQADLSPSLPPGFALDGLMRSVSLAPNAQTVLALTLRAQGVAVNTDHLIGLTAVFGPDHAQKRQVEWRVIVVAPGALQALQAASDALAVGRDALAATLESLGKGLSQLYGLPSDPAWRGRVLASLDTLGRQLDDPLLAPFGPGLVAARNRLSAATPDQVSAALESLGAELRAFAEFMTVLAANDFEVALQPNAADALPETATRFGLYLRNRGRQTTTYELRLDGVPAGITGGLTHSSLTLEPGQATSPTLSGVEHVSVVLTQTAAQLQSFPFSVKVQAQAAPAITRAATGAFTARDELVKVLSIEPQPVWIEPRWERTTFGVFTGGDAGEGLDLDGDFLYAVNVGGNAVGRVRDADFTGPNVPGVTLTAVWGGQHARELGSSDNDNRLETVLLTDRSGDPTHPVTVRLADLVPGRPYKLQLLLAEDWTLTRGFDVVVDGHVIANDFNPGGVQAGVSTRDRAVVLTHEFLAAAETVTIALDGSRVEPFGNREPLLCGLTLEAVHPEPVTVSARVLNAVNANRPALARLQVKGQDGDVVREDSPQPLELSTLASVTAFVAGRFDPTGLPPGVYRLAVTLSEADGTAITGAQGHGTFLVGAPIQAGLTVSPGQLAPGTGQVELTLTVTNRVAHGTNGITLLGLRDTPGTAQSLALAAGMAYVGGTESAPILNVSNPWNPELRGLLATNAATTAMAGGHLLLRRGFALDVFALDPPTQPARVGGCEAGFAGSTFPVRLLTHGRFAFSQALIFGYGAASINFVRGDLAMYDLTDPVHPAPLGLLFATAHTTYPEFVGSDYFIGQPAAKDGIVYLPSSTGKDAANSGTGRLIVVDARGLGRPAVTSELAIPDTRVLTAAAITGNRALVLGNTKGFVLNINTPVLAGDVTATVLDVTDPLHPAVLGPTQILDGIDQAVRWKVNAFPGPNNRFVLTQVARDGQAELWLVDASTPGALATTPMDVPASVVSVEVRGGLLYAAGGAGVAIYDLGGLSDLPVVAEVALPQSGAALVTGSFNVPPDELTSSPEYDLARWRFDLSGPQTVRTVRWHETVNELQPGTSREIAGGGSVAFTAWGSTWAVALPPLAVTCPHLLALTPASRSVRPGEPAAYTVSVTNPTDEPVTYTLTLEGLPTGWCLAPPTVAVATHGTAEVTFECRSETVAPEGEHRFRVWVRSGTLLADAVQGTLTLRGPPVRGDDAHGVILTLLPADVAAGRGTPAAVNVRLTNTGNVTERFNLAITPPPDVLWLGEPLPVEVPPGLDNYREARFVLTPGPGAAPGVRPFTVTAAAAADLTVQAAARGTLNVLPLGVALSLTPDRAPIGATFTLHVSNPGPGAQTYDLGLGGPLAAAARLGQATVTLEAGAAVTIPVMFSATNFAYPGEFPLLAGATARADARVSAFAAATVEVAETHGLVAWFDPELTGLLGPGEAAAMLYVRNAGNVEEACKLEIVGAEGPVTADLQGLEGQATQVIPRLRLPGLAGGVVLLWANLTAHQPGRVHVRLTSLSDPARSATATAHFLPGVWLSIEKIESTGDRLTHLWFTPLPGYHHGVEYRDRLDLEVPWLTLPGAPHDQGDATDPADRPGRFYRVRITRP